MKYPLGHKRLLAAIMLLIPVLGLAETVSIVIDAPTQATVIESQTTVVTPEIVTVTAVVNTIGTETLTIVEPGSQGIPGASTAGEGGAFQNLSSYARKGESVDFATVTANAVNVATWLTTDGNITSTNGSLIADQIGDNTGSWAFTTSLINHATATGNTHGAIAAQIPVTPAGNITATDAQGAILQAAANADWNAASGVAAVLNKPAFSRGYDGREIELQKSATHIQWRFVGDTSWTDLVLLSALTGTDGIDGINGDPGKTYSCAITGGIRSLLYDKNGSNPAPTMVAFGVELREDGAVVTPASYSWSVPASGSLLSGSGSAESFTPTVNGTFSAGSADNRVDVAVTYAGITCQATAPVPATKIGADGAAGSPDSKQLIYTKIQAGATGDVLRTQCGPGDAASFAAREVRDQIGNIILTYTCGGQVTVYNLPGDTAATIKLLVKKIDGSNGLVYKAGGTLELY